MVRYTKNHIATNITKCASLVYTFVISLCIDQEGNSVVS